MDKLLGLGEVRYSSRMSFEFSPLFRIPALSTKLIALCLRPSFYLGPSQRSYHWLFNDLLSELLSPQSRRPSGTGPYLMPPMIQGPVSISDATYDPGPGARLAQSSHQCTLGEMTLGQKHITTVSPLPLGRVCD